MDTDYCVECGEFRTDSGACGCGQRYEELSEECDKYKKVLEEIVRRGPNQHFEYYHLAKDTLA